MTQHSDNTGKEELVEEVGQLFDEYERTCANSHYGQAELDQCRQALSIQAITLMSQAIAKGKVKLPGEVGRAVWAKPGDEDHIYDWVADTIENGTRTFIALSPAERKEEDFEEFIMTETEAAIEGGIIDENTGLPFDLEGTGTE